MVVRIYLIVEEGMDRVTVQRTFPTWYKPPEGRKGFVYSVDIPVPDIELVSGKLTTTIVRHVEGPVCPTCDGAGSYLINAHGPQEVRCETCKGVGELPP